MFLHTQCANAWSTSLTGITFLIPVGIQLCISDTGKVIPFPAAPLLPHHTLFCLYFHLKKATPIHSPKRNQHQNKTLPILLSTPLFRVVRWGTGHSSDSSLPLDLPSGTAHPLCLFLLPHGCSARQSIRAPGRGAAWLGETLRERGVRSSNSNLPLI